MAPNSIHLPELTYDLAGKNHAFCQRAGKRSTGGWRKTAFLAVFRPSY
jgi:hypothetical protein